MFLVLLGIYPDVELLDHMAGLVLISARTSKLFSVTAAPFCIPISSVAGVPFSLEVSRIVFWYIDVFYLIIKKKNLSHYSLIL